MRIPFSIRVTAVTFSLLAGLALFAGDKVATNPEAPTASKMQEPLYDQEGRLLQPVGYEKWVVAGTSIGLGYSDGDKNDPQNPGTFHNVYLQPEAFDHYVQTGEFPEPSFVVAPELQSSTIRHPNLSPSAFPERLQSLAEYLWSPRFDRRSSILPVADT